MTGFFFLLALAANPQPSKEARPIVWKCEVKLCESCKETKRIDVADPAECSRQGGKPIPTPKR